MTFWKRETWDRPSENPTEGETPSVIDLQNRIEAQLDRMPAAQHPRHLTLLLAAMRTGSTITRLRVAVALGRQHTLGRTDHRRLALARRRYLNLPADLVGEHDRPVVLAEPEDQAEPGESWPHLLMRCYGVPFAVIGGFMLGAIVAMFV
ncbi:hypothetical protein SAMN05216466_10671 [Paraburkholderia phenazinium]|uniref:Uncharacterized protein n=1 Tax=Paraburkholderia phenazinium TaxID=60549 RepID=A0A1G7Y7Z5_9BURK|nr:hypothetical protein [Paraburkholderia phenazinium]SDG92443.1 hypothetical protein SAMN05216466_10671 [Paraburkholderia phenazinium]